MRKTISWILTLVIVLFTFPTEALSVGVNATTASEFLGGTGTAEDPFLISDKNHLNNVRNHLDAHFKMVTNITFFEDDFIEGGSFYNSGSKFKTIGIYGAPFTGTFDGNNKKISGIEIYDTRWYVLVGSPERKQGVALFGEVNGGLIKNLTIENFHVTARQGRSMGGLVGKITNGKIANCNASNVLVDNKESSSGLSSGIIAAQSENSEIIDCTVNGEVTNAYAPAGGIVGRALNNSIVSNCVSDTLISGKFTNYSKFGGVVGYCEGSSIESCTSNCRFAVASDVTYQDSTNAFGGIVGIAETSNISRCVNNTSFSLSTTCDMRTGGIIGRASDTDVSFCVNNGDVYTRGAYTYVGGIVGYNGTSSEISYCKNTAQITANSQYTICFAGGISGNGSGINDCYNVGTVTGYRVGGITAGSGEGVRNCYNVGQLNGRSSVYGISGDGYSNCYYDVACSGTGTGAVTNDELKNLETYQGFDFHTVWEMNVLSENTYPELIEFFEEIESVEILDTENRHLVLEGTYPTFNNTQIKVVGKDKKEAIVPLEARHLEDYDTRKLGLQNVYAKFAGYKSVNYITIEVVERSAVSITVKKLPDKLDYYIGEDFDPSGGIITITYDNGDTKDVQMSECDVAEFDKTIVGEQTLTLLYGDISTTLSIEVYTLSSIEVSSIPEKQEYILNQALDLNGGKIKLTYTNGTVSYLPLSEAQITYDKTMLGNVPVSVIYNGCETAFSITVNPRNIKYFELIQPEKLSYLEGESLDLTGAKFKVVFLSSDNYTEYIDISEDMITGYDPSVCGIQILAVDYGDFNGEFAIQIMAKSLEYIEITSKPNKLTYFTGDEIDTAGMVVTAYYNNNTSAVVSDYIVSGDTSTFGNRTVTVTYGETFATFEIQVNCSHNYTKYLYNNDAKCGVDGTETAYCDYGCQNTDTRTKLGSALEHIYDQFLDETCNECGDIRTIEIPIAFGGNSTHEEASGLAFQFNVAVQGMAMAEDNFTAVYENATVNGYKLLSMGADVTNVSDTRDVQAVCLCDLKENTASFAVRIINIPPFAYGRDVTATPYIVLEIDGVATTIYGEAQTCSYNDVKN